MTNTKSKENTAHIIPVRPQTFSSNGGDSCVSSSMCLLGNVISNDEIVEQMQNALKHKNPTSNLAPVST